MTIDRSFAAWLKASARYASAAPGGVAWPGAATSEAISPLAIEADAIVEAAAQAAFLGGPTVRDRVLVPGARRDLIGRCIRLDGDRLGYGAQPTGFVVKAEEQEGGTTALTIVRPMVPRPAPVGVSALRIAPVPSGAADGSSWADAAPLSALNSLIPQAAAIGAEVWLRADAGVYNQNSALTISTGGTTVRGVDVNGFDMLAEFVGSRAAPWSVGAAYGKEVLRLNSGADNLTLRSLRFRNQGAGCIRVRQPIANLTILDCDAQNVGRFFENYGTTANTDATISGLTIKRCTGKDVSKTFLRIRYNTHDVLVEDCVVDMGSISGDWITVGFQVDDGPAHDGVFRRCTVSNVYNEGPLSYWNGDGFSGERGNYNWLYEECSVTNSTDGGFDCKGNNIRFLRCRTENCKRGFRCWGDALVEDCIGINPAKQTQFGGSGGSGSVWHVGAMQHGDARVRVQGGTWTQTGAQSPFRVFDNAFLFVDAAAQAAVTKPSSTAMFAKELESDIDDGLIGTWNHADASPPTITGSLAFSAPENAPKLLQVVASEPVTMRVRGADAGKLNVVGRFLFMPALDYDVVSGPASDGSKVLKAEAQVTDANGNSSAWSPVTVTLTDVPDDPITPAQALAATGATAGFWYDIGNPESVWEGLDRTSNAVEGTPVKLVDDLSGFGNHLVFDDGREPLLRISAGRRYLQFIGTNVGKIGAPGAIRFPQLTAFCVFKRDMNDADSASYLMFAGRRSLTPSSSNGSFWLGVRDGASVFYRTTSTNATSSGIGGSHSKPVSLSYRSTDATFRSSAVEVIDGADVATITYALATEQALLGAKWDSDTGFVGLAQGEFYGAAMLDKAVADDTRFRIERQLATSAGLAL